MTEAITLTIYTLAAGGVYALIAIGIQLVFGLTGIANFAHGVMVTLGAYLVYTIMPVANDSYVMSLLAAVLALALVGSAMYFILFRPTLMRSTTGSGFVAAFIVSLGAIMVVENGTIVIWGASGITVENPLRGLIVQILGVPIGLSRVVVTFVMVVVLGVFFAVLRFSKHGRAIRACADDRETSRLLGIPVDRVTASVFAVGTGLAGLAGGLFATFSPIDPLLGTDFVLKGFAIAIISGIGNLPGTVLGAVLLAALETGLNFTLPSTSWTGALAFGVMTVVLILKPSGLFGGASFDVR